MTDCEMSEDDRVYCAGEPVVEPLQRCTDREKLALLNWHLMVSGRYPQYELRSLLVSDRFGNVKTVDGVQHSIFLYPTSYPISASCASSGVTP